MSDAFSRSRSAAGAAVRVLITEDGTRRKTRMEKTINGNGKRDAELRRNQAQPLHAIFSMTEIQAKIALCLVMYGTDLDYAVAVTRRLSPEN